jgi:hypothetical protein
LNINLNIMTDDTRKFIESIQESFPGLLINNGKDEIALPYLGKTDCSVISPKEILQKIYEAGFDSGKYNGKQEKIREIRKALDVDFD